MRRELENHLDILKPAHKATSKTINNTNCSRFSLIGVVARANDDPLEAEKLSPSPKEWIEKFKVVTSRESAWLEDSTGR